MTTIVRPFVAYRPNGKSKMRYIGPFVSETAAYRCMDQLPEPEHGGLRVIRIMEVWHSK